MLLCECVEDILNIGYKVDDLSFILVDLERIWSKNDSFIMTSHAKNNFMCKI